jgi:hypothetical protein
MIRLSKEQSHLLDGSNFMLFFAVGQIIEPFMKLFKNNFKTIFIEIKDRANIPHNSMVWQKW